MRVDLKYNSDFFDLFQSAREEIKRDCLNRPCYPIPFSIGFSELVLDVFNHCVYNSSRERGSPFADPRIPSLTDWPSVFPAYSTLKTYFDLTSNAVSNLESEKYPGEYPRYMREYINPGITSLLVLPFLEMLKKRKDDPAVVLAVHMWVLSRIRQLACPYIGPSWIRWAAYDRQTVCKEEMEEFMGCQEVVQWFGNHPQDVKEECDNTIVQDMKLVTRSERIKATLCHLEEERMWRASMAGYLQ